jgi:hypothetical protein
LDSWYADAGGPLALWGAWANDVRGAALDAGHFFPEEIPQRTAEELSGFFAAARNACARVPPRACKPCDMIVPSETGRHQASSNTDA